MLILSISQNSALKNDKKKTFYKSLVLLLQSPGRESYRDLLYHFEFSSVLQNPDISFTTESKIFI